MYGNVRQLKRRITNQILGVKGLRKDDTDVSENDYKKKNRMTAIKLQLFQHILLVKLMPAVQELN